MNVYKKKIYNHGNRPSAASSSCSDLLKQVFGSPINRKLTKKELEAFEAQEAEKVRDDDIILNHLDENDPWVKEMNINEEKELKVIEEEAILENELFPWDPEDIFEAEEETLTRNNFDAEFMNDKIAKDDLSMQSFEVMSYKGEFKILDIVLGYLKIDNIESLEDRFQLKGEFARKLNDCFCLFITLIKVKLLFLI